MEQRPSASVHCVYNLTRSWGQAGALESHVHETLDWSPLELEK